MLILQQKFRTRTKWQKLRNKGCSNDAVTRNSETMEMKKRKRRKKERRLEGKSPMVQKPETTTILTKH